MQIRIAEINDLAAIVHIYNSTIPSRMVTADTQSVSVAEKTDWFNNFQEPRPIWVAIENEQVIAWLSFKSFYGRPAYAGTIEIAIYIDEQFRAKGIGKTILQFAIAAAKERNIHTLLAYIFEHNLPSIQFFQKNGFVNYGVLPEIAIMDQKHYSLVI
ncbi:MAG: GNAT family N-acetyltransferase [Sphingobacteriaceae bacterium]